MNRLVESRVLKYKSIVYTVPATAVTSSYYLEHAAFEPNFMEYRITEYNGNIETCYTPRDTTQRILMRLTIILMVPTTIISKTTSAIYVP